MVYMYMIFKLSVDSCGSARQRPLINQPTKLTKLRTYSLMPDYSMMFMPSIIIFSEGKSHENPAQF